MLAVLVDNLQMASAIVVAIGVLTMALWRVYKIAHRLDQAIGVDAQGRSLAQRMDRVEHQLWPNGGSSLKDQVNRLETTAVATQTEIAIVKSMLNTLIERG